MTTPNEIREKLLVELAAVCSTINEATKIGLKIDFTIAANAQGEQTVTRFDVWQKVATN